MAVILETGMEAKALVLVEVKIAPLFVVVVAQTEISLCEYLFCTIVAVEDFDELVFVYGVSGAVVEPDGELFPVEFMAEHAVLDDVEGDAECASEFVLRHGLSCAAGLVAVQVGSVVDKCLANAIERVLDHEDDMEVFVIVEMEGACKVGVHGGIGMVAVGYGHP